MRFEYSPYELHFLNGGTRVGALLRTEVGSDWGYADLHPWVERGDLPLEQELSEFPYGSTRLGRRAMTHALAYGEPQSGEFENHGLLVLGTTSGRIEALRRLGFKVFKFKITDRASLENCLEILPALEGAPLRIDWNAPPELTDLFERSLSVFKNIDFIEDPPSSINSGIWAEDWVPSAKASIRVLKPAIMDPSRTITSRRTIVTSYLGHPVGQWADARAVGLLELGHEVHGLCSHMVYEENEFSAELGQGPQLRTPETWDFLLRKLPWKSW